MSNPIPEEVAGSKALHPGQVPTVDETSAFTPTDDGMPELPRTAGDSLIGTTIGRYRLLQKLGEGGMGSVYLAEQSEPVKRQVALKLIRGGVDSRTVIARFEAERQALAVMDHPNIARIYDGGTTASYQPFFVMELVQGPPITDYCDQHRLSPKQRLELFVPICQAVQHAHQKGIIHRDLKPSNVLVTEIDGKPVPKVIDFGVAKAIEQPLTDQSLGDTGAIVGTPTYMSPEQADPASMDIDTRTDIYALGVMLYELLTGSTPIDARHFRRGALLEVLRIVREVEPPRPSTKLSTAEALPSIAANRSLEPKQLQALLRNDIDWIVMKAIEKDRSLRYETANGFAADLQRYLSGEAVLAHPPSRWYRVKKFVRRYRGEVLAASLLAFTLIAGIIGTTWGLIEARYQAGVAETKRKEAEASEKAERIAKVQAQASLQKVTKGIEILGSIFKGLKPGQAEEYGKSLSTLLGERLDLVTQELDGEAVGDPAAVARLQVILAESQLGLGFAEKAVALCLKGRETLTRILGPESADTLTSTAHLAAAYQAAGKYDTSLPLHEERLKIIRNKYGPDHIETYLAMGYLGENYRVARFVDKALPLLKEALQGKTAKLGHHDPQTLNTMNDLALAYLDLEQFDQALPLLEKTTKASQERYGPNHPETLSGMNNLASAYHATKQQEKALPLKAATLQAMKTRLGYDHPETLAAMNNLAMGYHVAGQLDKARQLYGETLLLLKSKLGQNHPNTLMCMHNLAKVYLDSKKHAEAVKLLDEFVAGQRVQLASNPSTFSFMLVTVGNDLLNVQEFSAAEKYIRESLAIREKTAPELWNTFNTYTMLGEVLLRQKKQTEAEPLLLKGYEGMKQREKSIPAQGKGRIPHAIDRLIELYTETNKPDDVKKWQAEKAKWTPTENLPGKP